MLYSLRRNMYQDGNEREKDHMIIQNEDEENMKTDRGGRLARSEQV